MLCIGLRCIAQYHKVHDGTVRDGTRRCRTVRFGTGTKYGEIPLPNFILGFPTDFAHATMFGTYYFIL